MNNRANENIERVWGPTSAILSATPVTVTTSATTILSARTDGRRKYVILQNNNTEPCIIRLGGDASTTEYHFSLSDCTAARDGKGANLKIDNWQGSITGLTEANSTVISVLEMLSE